MGSNKVFYAPGVNRSVTLASPQRKLSQRPDGTGAPAVVSTSRMSVPTSQKHQRQESQGSDLSNTGTPLKKSRHDEPIGQMRAAARPPAPKVDNKVEAARDAFSALWTDFGTNLESEYDADFQAPPLGAYSGAAERGTKPSERLSWWNGGSHDNSGTPYPKGGKLAFFQDQRATYKRHVPGHVIGQETNPGLWKQFSGPKPAPWGSPKSHTAKPLPMEMSENHERFRAPPTGWPTPSPAFHAPPASINLTDEAGPGECIKKTQGELTQLRNEFEKEMSRLGETPSLPTDFHSTYAETFSNPSLREPPSWPLKRFAPGELSESEAAYRTLSPEAVQVVRARPAAGRKSTERAPSLFGGGPGPGPSRYLSEYEASFVTRDKMERAAAARDAAAAAAERKRAADMVELENSLKQVSKEEKKLPPHLEGAATAQHTEYRDRFCHGGDTCFIEDPGFMSDKGPEFIAPQPKVATEYQVAFEHYKPSPDVDFEKSTPHLSPLNSNDMPPQFTTEYEGAFCAADAAAKRAELESKKAEIENKTALKPAYALKPGSKGSTVQKSSLFSAEVNPGFVSRTESMRAFADPRTRGAKGKTGAHLDTMRLKEAKLSQEQATRRAALEVESQAQKAGLAQAPGPFPGAAVATHSERLRDENDVALKWWKRVGQKQWSKSNPITQYPRYQPLSNLGQIPKTEYQQSFVVSKTV